MRRTVLATLICFYVIEEAYRAMAILCYRCESTVDFDCPETFDKSRSGQRPQSCDDIFEAQYCIKATGMYQGKIGTHRFCSSRHHGNYCEYLRRPGDDREYRSCVYTCSSNACNAAYTAFRSNSLFFVCLLTLVTNLLVYFNAVLII